MIAALLLLAACSSAPGVEQRIASAGAKAEAAGFSGERVSAGPFVLQAFHRGLDGRAEHWHVYLEGDGKAFISSQKLSEDPTPVDPIGLDLALADPAPAVLYLGRPCQYRPQSDHRPCSSLYWSSHRFAEEVVEATASAIERLLARDTGPDAGVTLIGYSGGGALAALIAARSSRIDRLVTIAAPLDLSAWTRHHGVTPLEGSLDPLSIAQRLTMPQSHFSGLQDTVVPPTLQNTFLNRLSPTSTAKSSSIDNADHGCCWQQHWPRLLKSLPAKHRRKPISSNTESRP